MKRAWIISFLLAFASSAAATVAAGTFDVRLIEPAAQIELRAGSTASLAWEATDTPASVEEWEAFLSIDGGLTHPIRLTPHLDRSIQRFTWVVPSLPGAEATLLLRFGDEHDERQFAFPSRIRITGAGSLGLLRHEWLSESASGRSEEEDHGERLTQWVEGSRDGLRLRQLFACQPLLCGHDELTLPRDHQSSPTISSASKRFDPAAERLIERRNIFAPTSREGVSSPRPHPVDVLGLVRRLNI